MILINPNYIESIQDKKTVYSTVFITGKTKLIWGVNNLFLSRDAKAAFF